MINNSHTFRSVYFGVILSLAAVSSCSKKNSETAPTQPISLTSAEIQLQNSETLFQAALTALGSGDQQAAIEKLNLSLKENPANLPARLKLVEIHAGRVGLQQDELDLEMNRLASFISSSLEPVQTHQANLKKEREILESHRRLIWEQGDESSMDMAQAISVSHASQRVANLEFESFQYISHMISELLEELTLYVPTDHNIDIAITILNEGLTLHPDLSAKARQNLIQLAFAKFVIQALHFDDLRYGFNSKRNDDSRTSHMRCVGHIRRLHQVALDLNKTMEIMRRAFAPSYLSIKGNKDLNTSVRLSQNIHFLLEANILTEVIKLLDLDLGKSRDFRAFVMPKICNKNK